MSQRVLQARRLRATGYCPAQLARALGISRQAIYGADNPRPQHSDAGNQRGDDGELVAAVKAICSAHPRYGTRRLRVLLGRRGWHVNRKRAQRIMRAAGLLVPPLKAHPKGVGTPLSVAAPNQSWQTDLTKFWAGPNDGWAYVCVVVDCFTGEVLGHVVSRRCRTPDTLEALNRAVESRFPRASTVRRADLHLRRDHGSQFTSRASVDTLNTLGIIGQLTHYRHPDGNAFVERFFGTLKDEEIWWCTEHPDFESAKEAIDRFIAHYNVERPHSALGHRGPIAVWDEWSLRSEVARRRGPGRSDEHSTAGDCERHSSFSCQVDRNRPRVRLPMLRVAVRELRSRATAR